MQPMKTSRDRAALVARLLVAWDRAPEKRLGEFITAGLDAERAADVFEVDDEELVVAVEELTVEVAALPDVREPEESEDRRPVIRINSRASVNVNAAIVALRDGVSLRRWVVYVRDGVLVHDLGNGTRRYPPVMMSEMLCRVAPWEKQSRGGEWKPAHPPTIATAVIRRAVEWAPTEAPTVPR
jgi:hypothetical protein